MVQSTRRHQTVAKGYSRLGAKVDLRRLVDEELADGLDLERGAPTRSRFAVNGIGAESPPRTPHDRVSDVALPVDDVAPSPAQENHRAVPTAVADARKTLRARLRRYADQLDESPDPEPPPRPIGLLPRLWHRLLWWVGLRD